MKRFLSLALAIILTVGAFITAPIQSGFVISVAAEETTEPNESQTGSSEGEVVPAPESFLTYELNSDGNGYIVTGYNGEACDLLTIPAEYQGKPVTEIGDSAFEENQQIKKVISPNTIARIGYSAFYRSSLKEIDIPDSVTVICACAFEDSLIESIILPKNLKAIESYTFRSCWLLKEAVLPNGLTKIGYEAFRLCSNLEKITLPDSIAVIESMAFDSCSKLKSLTLPKSLKNISYQAFMFCSSLEEVIIQSGTTHIASGAFEHCPNLERVTLPNTIEDIFGDAFNDTKLYNDKSFWQNGALYISNYLIKIEENNNSTGAFKIKSGTVGLARDAFRNTGIVSIFLPRSVKSISRDAFSGVMIFYEGTLEEFNKIKFEEHDSSLDESVVILEATVTGTPAKPTVNKVSNVAGGVQISWNAVENADLYLVWRRGSGNSEWTLLGMTDQTTVIDTSAGHRQYWRYSVQGMNFDEISDFDYTGKYIKYIATPKLTGISNATNGIYFKWNAVSGASGYRVYRRVAGKSWVYLGTVKSTSYTDKSVKNASGNYYRYTVRAVVDGLYSGYEDFLYTKRLANPTLKSATKGNGGITVKWSAIKGTTGYYVYRKTANSNWVRIGAVGGTNNTTFVDKTAKSGTTYTYTVRAVYGSTTSYFNSGIKCKR